MRRLQPRLLRRRLTITQRDPPFTKFIRSDPKEGATPWHFRTDTLSFSLSTLPTSLRSGKREDPGFAVLPAIADSGFFGRFSGVFRAFAVMTSHVLEIFSILAANSIGHLRSMRFLPC